MERMLSFLLFFPPIFLSHFSLSFPLSSAFLPSLFLPLSATYNLHPLPTLIINSSTPTPHVR